MPNQSPLKNLSKEDGFTLIEVLVAINVAFIGLTVIITFYLFMSKFIFSSGKKIETSQMIYDSFYKIENILKYCEEFDIRITQDSVSFFINGQNESFDFAQIIFQKDEINIGDIYTIDNFEVMQITFMKIDGMSESWQPRADNEQTVELSSKEISEFNIEIEKNKTNYSWKYYTPAISANRFINLDN